MTDINTITNVIENMSNQIILELCDEIYEWRHTGKLKDNSHLSIVCENNHCEDYRFVEKLILNECLKRYTTVSKLLFVTYPSVFIN